MRPLQASASTARGRGFTVVELTLAVAILGVLTSVAYASYQGFRERAQVADAVSTIATIAALIEQHRAERGALPASLGDVGAGGHRDPWGKPYLYVSHVDPGTRGQWRKDHNIVPINSDYDLWSDGKDGASAAPLTAAPSRDDVVRANNGRFIGLASKYDP